MQAPPKPRVPKASIRPCRLGRCVLPGLFAARRPLRNGGACPHGVGALGSVDEDADRCRDRALEHAEQVPARPDFGYLIGRIDAGRERRSGRDLPVSRCPEAGITVARARQEYRMRAAEIVDRRPFPNDGDRIRRVVPDLDYYSFHRSHRLLDLRQRDFYDVVAILVVNGEIRRQRRGCRTGNEGRNHQSDHRNVALHADLPVTQHITLSKSPDPATDPRRR